MFEKKIIEIYPRLTDQEDREIGIEIEMEGTGLLPINTGAWKVTEDTSLRGEAKEYVLRRPIKRKRIKPVLEYLQEKLNEHGSILSPSSRCGVHIHLNCQHLTFQQTINIVVLYLIFEEILVKWCGESREGNLFCLRGKDAESFFPWLIYIIQNSRYDSILNNSYRYSSINITSLPKYGTLEFRAMRATTDFSLIATWIKLLLIIKDKALSFERSYNIIEAASFNGIGLFAKQIFEDMFEIIQCPNMDQLILDGIRQVQDIAYTRPNIHKEIKQPDRMMIDEADAFPINQARLFADFIQHAAVPPRPQRPERAGLAAVLNEIADARRNFPER